MKNLIYTIILLIAACSCQEGIIDGGLHPATVDQTTQEFLNTNEKFDTVKILFDRAGLTDQLKGNNTVIVPTDYTVDRYVKQLQSQFRREQNDENLIYTFADLLNDFDQYQDSMKMYIVNSPIGRTELEEKPYLTKSLLGNDVEISLKETQLYTEWFPNSKPKLVYYKWVKNGLDPVDTEVSAADRDISNICQTSSILTRNGVLHVLEDTHNLFFNKRQL